MTVSRSRPGPPGTAEPKPAVAPRGPGRPRQARPAAPPKAGKAERGVHAVAHRERLLDAAVALFAEHGVAATSFKQVAARAGVTPALVHYYFGDREGLLDAAADERLGPLVDRAFSSDGELPQAGVALLPDIAERLIRAAADTPWFPALWVREIVNGQGELRERVLRRFGLQRVGAVAGLLADARQRGELSAALAPPLLMVSVIGLALLPLATPHIWRRLPGADAIDTEALVRHVRALLTHGLAGPSTPSS